MTGSANCKGPTKYTYNAQKYIHANTHTEDKNKEISETESTHNSWGMYTTLYNIRIYEFLSYTILLKGILPSLRKESNLVEIHFLRLLFIISLCGMYAEVRELFVDPVRSFYLYMGSSHISSGCQTCMASVFIIPALQPNMLQKSIHCL